MKLFIKLEMLLRTTQHPNRIFFAWGRVEVANWSYSWGKKFFLVLESQCKRETTWLGLHISTRNRDLLKGVIFFNCTLTSNNKSSTRFKALCQHSDSEGAAALISATWLHRTFNLLGSTLLTIKHYWFAVTISIVWYWFRIVAVKYCSSATTFFSLTRCLQVSFVIWLKLQIFLPISTMVKIEYYL